MQPGQQPVLVLSEDTERERGKDAQKKNIEAAKAIAGVVRTTLGPKGMDKMLVDNLGDVTITNDGVTMLKDMDIEHPAAKMVIEVAETQDDECGDGTTSAVVLAGELLKKSEDLLDKDIHPSTIAKGYRMASAKAIEVLDDIKKDISIEDEEKLIDIATTAMTGKSIEMDRHYVADLAVRAIRQIADKENGNYTVNIDNIKVEKVSGSTVDKSELVDGIILDKERLHDGMPKEIEDGKIALLNSAIEIKETETDAEITITDTDQMQDFIEQEEESIKGMVSKIKESGADVVLCQKGIDDLAQHYLAKEGIFAIRRVKKSDMKKLAKSTGANIVTNLQDLEPEDLGEAGHIGEKRISGSTKTFIEGTDSGKSVSLLLRGGTDHVVDELERAVEDALKVIGVAIEDGAILPGGGATSVELGNRIQDYAGTVKGREQLAIEAFADSLSVIPRTLSENAGLDGIDILMEINAAHEKEGKKHHGINLQNEKIEDMFEARIIEPLRVKKQALESATEVTDMILRIDDVVASKGDGGDAGGPPGGPGGAPGGMPGGMGGGMPPGM
ncbi:MAG: thermosome subunit alpha [Candidatus Saliniplasma sp.]